MEPTTSSVMTLLWPVVGLAVLALGIYALFHLMGRQDLPEGKRLQWMMCIVLIPLLGPLLYVLRGKR